MKIKHVLAILAASLFSAGVSAQGVVAQQPAETSAQNAPQTQILAQAPTGQNQPTEGAAPSQGTPPAPASAGSTAAGGMSVAGATIPTAAIAVGVIGAAALVAVAASGGSSSSTPSH